MYYLSGGVAVRLRPQQPDWWVPWQPKISSS